jgi:hypothetical protein
MAIEPLLSTESRAIPIRFGHVSSSLPRRCPRGQPVNVLNSMSRKPGERIVLHLARKHVRRFVKLAFHAISHLRLGEYLLDLLE